MVQFGFDLVGVVVKKQVDVWWAVLRILEPLTVLWLHHSLLLHVWIATDVPLRKVWQLTVRQNSLFSIARRLAAFEDRSFEVALELGQFTELVHMTYVFVCLRRTSGTLNRAQQYRFVFFILVPLLPNSRHFCLHFFVVQHFQEWFWLFGCKYTLSVCADNHVSDT